MDLATASRGSGNMRHQISGRRTRQGLWVAAFTLAAASAASTAPVAETFTPTGSAPLIRENNLHQYRALRRMHAVSERFDHEGWMDAWTELDSE
jgi:hypothetical protein